MPTATDERLNASLELKAVNTAQRIIEGYASVFGNIDRQGDVVDAGAFTRTLKDNPDVVVLVGHNSSGLPVGEPMEMQADAKGLFTKTRIYNTSDGDDLLRVASARLASGKTLGMSIGYRTVDSEWEKGSDGEQVRRLKDVDLVEYSYLATPNFAANGAAGVTGTKDDRKDIHQQIAELTKQHEEKCEMGDECPLTTQAPNEKQHEPSPRLRELELALATAKGEAA